MVALSSLIVPILLSAVIVFALSSVIHMSFTAWHRSDYGKVPNEDKVMDALRPFEIPPGDYLMPRPSSGQDMRSPEFLEKMKKGPVIVLTVVPSGPAQMGKMLALWFLYGAAVSFFAAYIAGRALPVGADYLSVFRFVGAASFIGYSVALWQMSIWYHRSWTTTFKSTVDGFIYALFTAGTFGWLWPR